MSTPDYSVYVNSESNFGNTKTEQYNDFQVRTEEISHRLSNAGTKERRKSIINDMASIVAEKSAQ